MIRLYTSSKMKTRSKGIWQRWPQLMKSASIVGTRYGASAGCLLLFLNLCLEVSLPSDSHRSG